MGEIAQATLSAGGEDYTFYVYSTDTSFEDVSAVYIFTKRTVSHNKGIHSLLYVGETEELGSRIRGHEKWSCVNARGCNCICVHSVSGAQSRRTIEKAFRDEDSPPCNDQ